MTDRSPSAERQRRYRRRQRNGLVPVTLDVDEVGLAELLVASGHLAEAQRDDRAALRDAAERWLATLCDPDRYESVTASLRAALRSGMVEP